MIKVRLKNVSSFKVIGLLVSEKNFIGFLHCIFIWARWLSWSKDNDQSNKPLFPLHIPIRPDMEFAAMIGPVISEKKMFDEC